MGIIAKIGKWAIITILYFNSNLNAQDLDDLNFGTDETFEVMTWNIEWFPKNDQITVDYVTQIIQALDIDLLLYGNLIYKSELVTIPRPDILEYSFVLKPLSVVAPDLIHPLTKKTIQEHWQIMNKKKNSLEMIDLKIT